MKILNFGSLNMDMVYAVDHFVRPGETISSERLERFSGGKGLNQSLALARAGAHVWHAGCIGEDGRFLADTLQQGGVNTQYVRVIDSPTGHAIIQVDKTGQNCILLFGGANQLVDAAWAEQVLSTFEPGDWLLLQNEINGLAELMSIAARRGLRIALNPSPMNDAVLQLPLELTSLFLCNEIEGSALTGKTDAQAILDEFRNRYPESAVVLTLGSQGAWYADGAERCFAPIFPAKVVDTTAAGDTFTGYFLAGLTRGDTPEDCMRWASMASSLAVSRKGAAASVPLRQEVGQALEVL